MRMSWLWVLLLAGCPAKDTGSTDDSDSAQETGTTETGETGDSDCEEGPGVIDGVLLGSDGFPLTSGKVRLYDSTGSEELVADDVDAEGTFHLVYGKGDYAMRGEYSTCVGEDIAVTICGNVTINKNVTLSCAP